VAIAWIAFISVLFILPNTPAGVWFSTDFTWAAANYTPLTLAVVLLLVGGWWYFSARHWFTGPIREVDATTVPGPETELAGESAR
jgi:hypothetical protein